jgi:hypothetical protein
MCMQGSPWEERGKITLKGRPSPLKHLEYATVRVVFVKYTEVIEPFTWTGPHDNYYEYIIMLL